MKIFYLALCTAMLCPDVSAQDMDYKPYFDFQPLTYVCHRTPSEIKIDGDIDDALWAKAQWTEPFRDIQGSRRPVEPAYPTRAKMMWDDNYLYIAAEMVEPHIWATMTKRDDVIYYDNDIEVFIDPDGDGHNYYEFEFNAHGTEWDLLLTKPYARSGTFFNGWDLKGMRSAVKHYGTINDPSDTDKRWTIEIAMPMHALIACMYQKGRVEPGEQWRINFSRVEWMAVSTENGKYTKHKGKEGFGNEDNWVWSPTGVIDMHFPELWGLMQFSPIIAGQGCDTFVNHPRDIAKRQLRVLADRALQYRHRTGHYPTTIEQLKPEELSIVGALYYPAGDGYKLSVPEPAPQSEPQKWWSLTNDGRVFWGK